MKLLIPVYREAVSHFENEELLGKLLCTAALSTSVAVLLLFCTAVCIRWADSLGVSFFLSIYLSSFLSFLSSLFVL
jgi:hypothetical protein